MWYARLSAAQGSQGLVSTGNLYRKRAAETQASCRPRTYRGEGAWTSVWPERVSITRRWMTVDSLLLA